MRLFPDECLSPAMARALNAEGAHAVMHPRDFGGRGAPDRDVLARCVELDHVLVTANARDFRAPVAADPGRYLDIPSLDGGDCNLMLRDFLRSHWTDDEARRRRAADACSGRIGQWNRRVGDRDTIHAFNASRDRRAGELAGEFLRGEGIEPRWK